MPAFSNDEITMDYHHFLNFTGWNTSTYKKRTSRARIDKLKNIGARDIHVTGNGTRAIYNFKLAPMFWPVFLTTCQGIEYDEVAEAYLDKLMSEGLTEETSHGKVFLFSTEVYEDITSYLNDRAQHSRYTYQGVKTKCDRIRTKFKNVGYFAPKYYLLNKTHRAKVNDEWVRGAEAYKLSERILNEWRHFYKEIEQQYFHLYPQEKFMPHKIKNKAARDFQQKELPFKLGIQHTQSCIEKKLDKVFFEDLRFAQERFLQTYDLQIVKKAILDRQSRRSHEIQREEEAGRRSEENHTALEDETVPSFSDTDINLMIAELNKKRSSVFTESSTLSSEAPPF